MPGKMSPVGYLSRWMKGSRGFKTPLEARPGKSMLLMKKTSGGLPAAIMAVILARYSLEGMLMYSTWIPGFFSWKTRRTCW